MSFSSKSRTGILAHASALYKAAINTYIYGAEVTLIQTLVM
jgi:hypothetical protein